jgi:hypothetical protein
MCKIRKGHNISAEKFKGKKICRSILEGEDYVRMDLHEAE